MLSTHKQLVKGEFVTVWSNEGEDKLAAATWTQEIDEEDEDLDEEE